MSVNIKMNQHGMCISVNLSNNDSDYEVNTNGFLSTLEDFLSKLEFYENVDIEIKKKYEPPSYGTFPFDTDGITVTTGPTMSDTITVSTADTSSTFVFDNSGRL